MGKVDGIFLEICSWKRSIILTAAGAITPTANGAAQTKVDSTNTTYYVLDYDKDNDEAAFWQWTMPDSYDDGTIDVTYYWTVDTATTTDVVWCFQATGTTPNVSENIDSPLSSALCVTDTALNGAGILASATTTNATSSFAAGEYAAYGICGCNFRNFQKSQWG